MTPIRIRTRRLVAAAATVAVAATGAATSAPAAGAEPALSGDDLLARLVDPAALAEPLPAGARVVQASSHEREGGNRDWGVWSDAQGRPPTFVRREPGGFVLLDERRPGCLARMWFTTTPIAVPDISRIGRVQLFFDGERSPRVDLPAADLFAGRAPGFPPPLVGDAESSSGGHFSYVPFCFARSLKVRITAVPDDAMVWYQLTQLVLPHGTRVRTFEPARQASASAAAAERLRAAGAAPPGAPVVAERALSAGDRLRVVERRGRGSIRHMRFAVEPFTPQALAALELRVRADGGREPQLAVPLGALLGDGLDVRPIRALAFGMDPAAGSGYLALPVPFADGVSVELAASGRARVRAETWLGPPTGTSWRLHGRRSVELTRRGRDFTALAAPGAGVLAAWVLDVAGPPFSDMGPVQFFLEGDERVHVDGSPSPSIYGTGTEDAFNGGFYYSRGAFSLPTHGAGTFLGRDEGRGARSQYRTFGGDGFLWEGGIRLGMEHGGGDERDGGVAASTALWYAGPARLRRTDALRPANRRSAARHGLTGRRQRTRLTAYFEGELDGNAPDSPFPLTGGQEYPAPPPERSPEAVTAAGVAFRRPIAFDLRVAPRNCGVVLRRQLDAERPSRVAVWVDGRRAGAWSVADPNPAKRWRSDDFALHARHTAGRRRIRVRLAPERGSTATAFRVEALTRRCGAGAG